MSTAQCNRFVQNAWKKELCSNCFKPREEHASPEETFRVNIGRALNHVKTDNFKLQVFSKIFSNVERNFSEKFVCNYVRAKENNL